MTPRGARRIAAWRWSLNADRFARVVRAAAFALIVGDATEERLPFRGRLRCEGAAHLRPDLLDPVHAARGAGGLHRHSRAEGPLEGRELLGVVQPDPEALGEREPLERSQRAQGPAAHARLLAGDQPAHEVVVREALPQPAVPVVRQP